jgi:hypothetical protein
MGPFLQEAGGSEQSAKVFSCFRLEYAGFPRSRSRSNQKMTIRIQEPWCVLAASKKNGHVERNGCSGPDAVNDCLVKDKSLVGAGEESRTLLANHATMIPACQRNVAI